MNAGDIVFFRGFKSTAKPRAPYVTVKGHAFGIMLGHVPMFAKDPPIEHILRIMGSQGWISFDDVQELLGEEVMKDLASKFAAKYGGLEITAAAEEADPDQAELPLEPVEPERPSGLIGLDGAPLTSVDPQDPQPPGEPHASENIH